MTSENPSPQPGPSAQGIVYTETVVFSPPEQYAADAPYQLAIVDLNCGERLTVRVLGKDPAERARIGDTVVFAEVRNEVAYYRKAPSSPVGESAETPRPLI